jgi:thiol-disulfide isomerase/thioredoxin
VTVAADHKIVLEVMYKADYCLPCYYMDETVRQIVPKYGGLVEYRRVDFMKDPGKQRFLELSCSLFGKQGVYRHCRLAPVPSLFIDGELVFDGIPPSFELEEAIEEALAAKQGKESTHGGSSDLAGGSS